MLLYQALTNTAEGMDESQKVEYFSRVFEGGH